MDIKIKSYGKYNGAEYDEIFITNDNNVTFVFSNLGARITKLRIRMTARFTIRPGI